MVKFGKYLESHQIPEWSSQYVRYKRLKKVLKQVELEHGERMDEDAEHGHGLGLLHDASSSSATAPPAAAPAAAATGSNSSAAAVPAQGAAATEASAAEVQGAAPASAAPAAPFVPPVLDRAATRFALSRANTTVGAAGGVGPDGQPLHHETSFHLTHEQKQRLAALREQRMNRRTSDYGRVATSEAAKKVDAELRTGQEWVARAKALVQAQEKRTDEARAGRVTFDDNGGSPDDFKPTTVRMRSLSTTKRSDGVSRKPSLHANGYVSWESAASNPNGHSQSGANGHGRPPSYTSATAHDFDEPHKGTMADIGSGGGGDGAGDDVAEEVDDEEMDRDDQGPDDQKVLDETLQEGRKHATDAASAFAEDRSGRALQLMEHIPSAIRAAFCKGEHTFFTMLEEDVRVLNSFFLKQEDFFLDKINVIVEQLDRLIREEDLRSGGGDMAPPGKDAPKNAAQGHAGPNGNANANGNGSAPGASAKAGQSQQLQPPGGGGGSREKSKSSMHSSRPSRMSHADLAARALAREARGETPSHVFTQEQLIMLGQLSQQHSQVQAQAQAQALAALHSMRSLGSRRDSKSQQGPTFHQERSPSAIGSSEDGLGLLPASEQAYSSPSPPQQSRTRLPAAPPSPPNVPAPLASMSSSSSSSSSSSPTAAAAAAESPDLASASPVEPVPSPAPRDFPPTIPPPLHIESPQMMQRQQSSSALTDDGAGEAGDDADAQGDGDVDAIGADPSGSDLTAAAASSAQQAEERGQEPAMDADARGASSGSAGRSHADGGALPSDQDAQRGASSYDEDERQDRDAHRPADARDTKLVISEANGNAIPAAPASAQHKSPQTLAQHMHLHLKFRLLTAQKPWRVLEKALQELYKGLHLLRNYKILNFTALVKILKKYQKLRDSFPGFGPGEEGHWAAAETLLPVIQSTHFLASPILKAFIRRVELIFASTFTQGDHKAALDTLRVVQPKMKPSVIFNLGILLGLCAIMFGLMFLCAAWYASGFTKDVSLRMSVTIPVWRGIALIILHLWGWAINSYLFHRYRINHEFIFEINPRTELKFEQLMLIAATFTAVWFVLLDSFLFVGIAKSAGIWSDAQTGLFPFTLFVCFLIIVFMPLDTFFRPTRWYLLRTVYKIVTAPFHQVDFKDFYVGDQLTSLVNTFNDWMYSLCWLGSGHFLNDASSDPQCTSVQNDAVWVVAALPYFWRFLQCLRKYYDAPASNTRQLWNAGKYASSICTTFLSLGYKFYPSLTTKALWITMAVITTMYTFSWDVYADWGLVRFEGGSWRPVLLRKKLVLQSHIPYYFAIVSDLVLRVAWVFTISATGFGLNLNHDYFNSVVWSLEVIRRNQWNFYRLENEFVGNVESYRVVNIVPLKMDAIMPPVEERAPEKSKSGSSGKDKSTRGGAHSSAHRTYDADSVHGNENYEQLQFHDDAPGESAPLLHRDGEHEAGPFGAGVHSSEITAPDARTLTLDRHDDPERHDFTYNRSHPHLDAMAESTTAGHTRQHTPDSAFAEQVRFHLSPRPATPATPLPSIDERRKSRGRLPELEMLQISRHAASSPSFGERQKSAGLPPRSGPLSPPTLYDSNRIGPPSLGEHAYGSSHSTRPRAPSESVGHSRGNSTEEVGPPDVRLSIAVTPDASALEGQLTRSWSDPRDHDAIARGHLHPLSAPQPPALSSALGMMHPSSARPPLPSPRRMSSARELQPKRATHIRSHSSMDVAEPLSVVHSSRRMSMGARDPAAALLMAGDEALPTEHYAHDVHAASPEANTAAREALADDLFDQALARRKSFAALEPADIQMHLAVAQAVGLDSDALEQITAAASSSDPMPPQRSRASSDAHASGSRRASRVGRAPYVPNDASPATVGRMLKPSSHADVAGMESAHSSRPSSRAEPRSPQPIDVAAAPLSTNAAATRGYDP